MRESKSLLSKYKNLLWVLATIVITVGVSALVVWPQAQAFLADRDKITDLNTQASDLNQKATQLESVDRNDLDQSLKVVFTILPTDANVGQSVVTLQQMASNSSFTLETIKFSGGPAGKVSDNFKLATTGKGTMDQIKAFLDNLNKSPRVFQVESVGARLERFGDTTLDAEVPFVVYYKSAPPAGTNNSEIATSLTDREKKLLNDLKDVVAQAGYTSDTDISINVPLGKDDPFK